ncbi:polysaccharide deacetylase family protein [Thermocatellispora tengchongensis]|uniref:polysaccharide deacetylase family protein n=1 Tax=Thermocatellispora tengchongensis TaxID=1073253 RepID=UPI0036433E6E
MPLPQDKQFALAVTVDFDAHAAWLAKGRNDPAILARGEFGAEVGVPRLLDIFDRYRIPTTWGIPGHSIMTWPDACKDVLARGHEVCAHGVYHENLTDMPEPIERKLMAHQIQQHLDVLGTRPRGYRAPSGSLSYNTFEILEEFGLDWHSSLSGRDFEPYHPGRSWRSTRTAPPSTGGSTGCWSSRPRGSWRTGWPSSTSAATPWACRPPTWCCGAGPTPSTTA